MLAPAIRARLAADPATPLLTWYDEGREAATGERLELSGATAANWAAKVANLLLDECGAGVGDEVLVAAPAHWLTAAVLWGCWSAGVTVRLGEPRGPVAVAFVHEPLAGSVDADEVYGLALTAMAGPVTTPGLVDAVRAVRVHGDALPSVAVPAATPALLVGDEVVAHGDLLTGATPGRRLLVTPWTSGAAVLAAVTHPWTPGGSAVLTAGPLPGERAAAISTAERVTSGTIGE